MKRLCAWCRQRPAILQIRGKFKADEDHDLCQQCYRSAVDQQKAKGMKLPEIER